MTKLYDVEMEMPDGSWKVVGRLKPITKTRRLLIPDEVLLRIEDELLTQATVAGRGDTVTCNLRVAK